MRNDIDPATIHHPSDLLSAEHRTIVTVLDAIDAELARAGAFRPAFWRRVTEFITEFADRCHHGKEEDLLFPALEAAGLPCGGPTTVMRQEHAEGRDCTRRMREGTDAGDAAATRAAARAYVDLLRQHIEKEDEILFDMARHVLPQADADALLARFRSFDADDIGDAEIHRLAALARGLTAEAGGRAVGA